MKYLLLLLTIFLTSCSKPTFDIWDKIWDRIDNGDQSQVSESDKKLILEADNKEWEEVDKK